MLYDMFKKIDETFLSLFDDRKFKLFAEENDLIFNYDETDFHIQIKDISIKVNYILWLIESGYLVKVGNL